MPQQWPGELIYKIMRAGGECSRAGCNRQAGGGVIITWECVVMTAVVDARVMYCCSRNARATAVLQPHAYCCSRARAMPVLLQPKGDASFIWPTLSMKAFDRYYIAQNNITRPFQTLPRFYLGTIAPEQNNNLSCGTSAGQAY